MVLPDGKSRAYLEDCPAQKVFGSQRGTWWPEPLEQIKNDRVVLRRGGETYEVLLPDPTKPPVCRTPGRTIARGWRSGPAGGGEASGVTAGADHGHPPSRAAAASNPLPPPPSTETQEQPTEEE